MVQGGDDEHDELFDIRVVFVAEWDLLFTEISQVVLTDGLKRFNRGGHDSGDMGSQHLLLDLIDFEAEFLAIRRVDHEAL